MRLNKARIKGFQSFSDTGDITFQSGINLIVGPNNVGKSSVLKSLQPSLEDDRHRTPEIWSAFEIQPPAVLMSIAVSGAEIRRAMFQSPGSYSIPLGDSDEPKIVVDELLSRKEIVIDVESRPNMPFASDYPAHKGFVHVVGRPKISSHTHANAGSLTFIKAADDDDAVPQIVQRIWQDEMFYFSAERMNVGLYESINAPRLTSNASNLPAVLLTLAGSRGDLFQKIVSNAREILPNVGNISVNPVSNSRVEVRIWPTESMQNVELSFPLAQSGTGVSQVIAILAATVTANNSLIIIDEINSFLHPAAIKSLLRVLQEQYSQHQYIISTHSPEVIGFSNPSTIHLVRRTGYESQITELDVQKVSSFQEIAQHIGVSMTDVFAADRVIWVEGQTEELCFPSIYANAAGRSLPRGVVFTSVVATGDFLAKRRDRTLVYEIYERLSAAALPLSVGAIFSFDSETFSETEKAKMISESRGKIHFLPRRHIECFAIHPISISQFIFEKDETIGRSALLELVSEHLRSLASIVNYVIPPWKGDIEDIEWLKKVDAANLIADTCSLATDHRVTFNKKNDTLRLLQLVKKNSQANLAELEEYVSQLVMAVS